MSSVITSNAGSSKVFDLGLVTYSNQAKQKILKVPNKIIKKYGAVSAQCCLSMVNNLSKIRKINARENINRKINYIIKFTKYIIFVKYSFGILFNKKKEDDN